MPYNYLCLAAQRLDVDLYKRLQSSSSPLKKLNDKGRFEIPSKYFPSKGGLTEEEESRFLVLDKMIKEHVMQSVYAMLSSQVGGVGSVGFG